MNSELTTWHSASMAFRHVRRHWKKYAAGQFVGIASTSYLIGRLREKNVIREYCHVAKTFGEKKTGMLERPKKVMVVLNHAANNSDAKIQFAKYAAPLLYLSGLDITVVESEYQGHIRMLMNYVDPKTDAIVIAGGDGTIMEVLNGLMQRQDSEVAKAMVVGILPLGKENRSFKNLFPSANWTSKARNIGEATLWILHGLTRKAPVMEILPEKGRAVFALSSVQWGAFKDAMENRDRFWVFGKLRLLASHIGTAMRGWPGEAYPSQWTFQCTQPPSNSPAATEVREDISGFKLSATSDQDRLSVTTWPLADLSKSTFLKHGWCRTTGLSPEECAVPGKEWVSREVRVTPPGEVSGDGKWLSVDGEEYEVVPMHIKLRPQHLTVFSPHLLPQPP